MDRTLKAWHNMRRRCAQQKSYAHVTVCESWAQDYYAFLADMGECPPGYSLERRRNESGYQPDNCHWIPLGDQAKNRGNVTLTQELAMQMRADLKSLSVRAVMAKYGVGRTTVYDVSSGKRW
jgi:hypothetical protein